MSATGADGGGTLSFLNAYSHQAGTATLEIDKGVKFADSIIGIGDSDTMDLKGFAFGSGVTDTFSNGTLTLHSDSGMTKLLLPRIYTASECTFAKDVRGGTVISFHHT